MSKLKKGLKKYASYTKPTDKNEYSKEMHEGISEHEKDLSKDTDKHLKKKMKKGMKKGEYRKLNRLVYESDIDSLQHKWKAEDKKKKKD